MYLQCVYTGYDNVLSHFSYTTDESIQLIQNTGLSKRYYYAKSCQSKSKDVTIHKVVKANQLWETIHFPFLPGGQGGLQFICHFSLRDELTGEVLEGFVGHQVKPLLNWAFLQCC